MGEMGTCGWQCKVTWQPCMCHKRTLRHGRLWGALHVPPSPKVPCMRLDVVGPWALNAFESHLKCSAHQRNMHMAVRTIDPRHILVINDFFNGR